MLDRFRRESDREEFFKASWYLKPKGDSVVAPGLVPTFREGLLSFVWSAVSLLFFWVVKFFVFEDPGDWIRSRSRICLVVLLFFVVVLWVDGGVPGDVRVRRVGGFRSPACRNRFGWRLCFVDRVTAIQVQVGECCL